MLHRSVAIAMLPLAQDRTFDWGWGMHSMWGVWGLGMALMMLLF